MYHYHILNLGNEETAKESMKNINSTILKDIGLMK